MLLAFGFLRTIFEVFDRHQTSVDVVTTSEVSVSMTLDDTNELDAIRRDLEGICEVTSSETRRSLRGWRNLKSLPALRRSCFSDSHYKCQHDQPGSIRDKPDVRD